MSNLIKTTALISFGGAIVGTLFYFGYNYCNYKKRIQLLRTPPEKWNKIGTLEEIIIYPIKSCSGIDLKQVECSELGLIVENFVDRVFALLDERNPEKLLTARTYPNMLKIKTKVIKDLLIVSAPNMSDLEICLNDIELNDMISVDVWGSNAYVTKCGRKYDKWFSEYLFGKTNGALFVYYKFDKATKPIIPKYKTETFLEYDTGSLHDCSSYLLIHQPSIDDLNSRLKEDSKVTFRQFRPNFLIKTNQPPFDEDNWNWIKIGDNTIFQNVVPCYRCIFTNINPKTSERHPDFEPLKTLKTYRVWGKLNSPRMGIQLGIRNTGTVKIGDNVYIG